MEKRLSSESIATLPPATAVVVGLGKIGLPLAVQYARHGWYVIGCDVNPDVVEQINAGRSHIHEEPDLEEAVAQLVQEGRLRATSDTTAAVRQARAVVVIVPVLIDEAHRANLTALEAATRSIGRGLQPETLVLYETTLPVGTTARHLAPLLESESGLQAGSDFWLAYSPERVSSGTIFRDLRLYPKVVGGINPPSTEAAVAFYRSVLDTSEIIVMPSTDDAEFVKLIETTYRDVNIALANEFARFADAHGLDVQAAIAAANSQPYSHIHTPSVGVGGHCIPVYPYFLLAGAEAVTEQVDGFAPLLQLPRQARAINDSMATYAVRRLEMALGSLRGQTVLILGIAYRGDVRELAFSSAALLRTALEKRGAHVLADDPLFSSGEIRAAGYTPFSPSEAAEVRAIILQAAHTAYRSFDFRPFSHCQVVLDGRQALQRSAIEALGMRYLAIGDGSPGRTRQRQLAASRRQEVTASSQETAATTRRRPKNAL
ncbi:MAG: nucleotide sugar dehydrogenase [Thermogemmatispora sp.]|jgi:nucleotide sugar dehydrogenase|uniref:Nucleotide sugar dehydrogenase n=1 Tax=Thermogemmatispora aurantia TaxID=2045279 RepID=A0A5J4K9H0_9CHLR|nr:MULTISPECIES: nucleotide sugar dehydrogenase [Thermogemmatispora]MBE3566454.1 nucleotide sugar dehydrogenase [Thermogemmatispora sp.]GER85238.1 nucleotide sugar dehydrogenase [Thermogemmatispora aurantia]